MATHLMVERSSLMTPWPTNPCTPQDWHLSLVSAKFVNQIRTLKKDFVCELPYLQKGWQSNKHIICFVNPVSKGSQAYLLLLKSQGLQRETWSCCCHLPGFCEQHAYTAVLQSFFQCSYSVTKTKAALLTPGPVKQNVYFLLRHPWRR